MPKKPAGRKQGKGINNLQTNHNVVSPDNDNLSRAFADIVPQTFRGTDRYLDVVQWNLEWFGAQKSTARDKKRANIVLDILQALNGDLFILQEVAGPSRDGRYPGSLDMIAEELTTRGAGDYVVYYTRAGGEQRVAMMWDREWVRAKTDVDDLFPQGTYKTADGRDAFGQRTPLYGYFTTRVPSNSGGATGDGDANKFDFQALGVHLKAMVEGGDQRLASAKVLANWLTVDAPKIDADVLVMGDWNAPPDDPCWSPLHALETGSESKIAFRGINDPTDYSYLWLQNRSTRYVSRIDLTAMSLSSMKNVVGEAARVVRWKPIQDAIAGAGTITAKRVKEVMEMLKDQISDHLPTATRFYFSR